MNLKAVYLHQNLYNGIIVCFLRLNIILKRQYPHAPTYQRIFKIGWLRIFYFLHSAIKRCFHGTVI